MSWRIDEIQEIFFSIVIIEHTCRLRFHRNPWSLSEALFKPTNLFLFQLSVYPRLVCCRRSQISFLSLPANDRSLHQGKRGSTTGDTSRFPMINMGDDTEIPDIGSRFLKFAGRRLRSGSGKDRTRS